MQEFLFNPALWMPALALAVAIALFVYGNNRVDRSIRNTALGLFAVVAAWCAAAFFVETKLEQCITRTHNIVAAVEAADWKKMSDLLDTRTTLEFLQGRDAIVNATQGAAQNYGLKDIRVFRTVALRGPNTVDVTFDSLLEGVQPLTATFRFEYEERSDGMLLTKIVPVRMGNKSMDQVRSAIR